MKNNSNVSALRKVSVFFAKILALYASVVHVFGMLMTEVPGVNIGIVIHFGMVVALLGLAALTQWATHYSFVRTVCWGLASTAMVFSVRQLWRNLTYDNDPQWLGVQFGVLELSVIAILAWHIRARYAWKGESA